VKFLLTLCAFALISAACGGPDSGAGVPTVDITRLEANGVIAILEFTVEDDSGSVTVTIDWGDDTEPETFVGTGASAATHEYPPDIIEVVVTLIATDGDGYETRAGRALTLGLSTTTVPVTSTTSSPTTTTTGSETTTTGQSRVTTTPSTTTTTTLPPEAIEQIHELKIQAADSVDELISPVGADGTAAPSGGVIDLLAETFGFDGGIISQSRIQWLIPEEEWSLLGPEARLSVVMDFEYSVVLRTGPNPGRAAGFEVAIVGSNDAQADLGVGSAAVATIGAGDLVNQGDIDRTGFGTLLPANASGPIRVTLVSTCSVSAGTTPFQIGESSLCRADLRPTIRVTLSRNEGP
jgi:hypothetical protein